MRRVPTAVLLAAPAIAAGLYLLKALGSTPAPTDDLFYIDAAWRLQNGSYATPSPDFPYHHYLRWTVFAPLAGLIELFGMSSAVLGFYAVFWDIAAAMLLLLVLRRMGVATRHAVLGSLAPFVVPAELFPSRVMSEGPASVYLLLSCLFVLGAGGPRSTRPFLAGAFAALAVNATMVALFSAFVPPLAYVLTRRMDRGAGDGGPDAGTPPPPSALRLLLLYGGGAAAMYATILLLEGLALGDPFLQYKTVTWWHLKAHRHVGLWSWLSNHRDPSHFVLGFGLNVFDHQPLWLAFIATAALSRGFRGAAAPASRSRRAATSVWLLGGAAFVALELLGSLALGKEYLRFLAIPSLFLTAGALLVLGLLLGGVRDYPARLLPAAALAALALLVFRANLRQFDADIHTTHYAGACGLVIDDLEGRRPRGRPRVLIVTEVPEVPALVGYRLACDVYSAYAFRSAQYVSDVTASDVEMAGVTYYVSWKAPEKRPPGIRWTQLTATDDPPQGAPAVFVAEPRERRWTSAARAPAARGSHGICQSYPDPPGGDA